MTPWLNMFVISTAVQVSPVGASLGSMDPIVCDFPVAEEPCAVGRGCRVDPKTASQLGRLWTEDQIEDFGASPQLGTRFLLAATPGLHVDRNGGLWLSGSEVHTILLDGAPVWIERTTPVGRAR